MEGIILYSTGCPKCNVLQKKLDAAKIPYSVCTDISTMRCLGILEAPKLQVDGKLMSFAEAVNWVSGKKE